MPSPLVSNPGSLGYTFGADEISTTYYPKSKLVYGGNGTATDVTGSTPFPVEENVQVTETDASQTVSTAAVQLIAAGVATSYVRLQNGSTSGQLLGYTFDGSTPVIGAAGTFILLPYGSDRWDSRIPSAKLQVIGSAASTIATCKYA